MAVKQQGPAGAAEAKNEVAAGKALVPSHPTNRGVPLNLDWIEEVRVNTTAVERRAASMGGRRTVKKEWQAAWLLRAITCMDLTTLSGDDTAERVKRLCAKAKYPLQTELVKRLGIESLEIKVAAVCVYHLFVETAVQELKGSGIHVAAVSTGFPTGLSPLAERVAEIRRSVEAGADEIDVYGEVSDDAISVFVRDRGSGFDRSAVPTDRRGLTESIERRLERAGGRAAVLTAPGEGTEVELHLPRRQA